MLLKKKTDNLNHILKVVLSLRRNVWVLEGMKSCPAQPASLLSLQLHSTACRPTICAQP